MQVYLGRLEWNKSYNAYGNYTICDIIALAPCVFSIRSAEAMYIRDMEWKHKVNNLENDIVIRHCGVKSVSQMGITTGMEY